jgi:hypothetical protein
VPTVQPEVLTFTQTGATGGTLNFQMIRKSGTIITYNVNYTVAWNATTSAFTNMLNAFDAFNGFNPVVTLQMFDQNGNVVTTGIAYQYVWTVTINMYRGTAQTNQNFITTASALVSTNASMTPTITIVTTQAHSPPVSGTYSLSLGNLSMAYLDSNGDIQTAISYDTSASQLESWMATAWDCPSIEVTAA